MLKREMPSARIGIVEREGEIGLHASGRNSGVLHAGIYYDTTSLKARFCRDGSRRMQDFCGEHGLPVARAGKVIVPSGRSDESGLKKLKTQADANGVRTELINRQQLLELEPHCASFETALYSPDTAAVDPKLVLAQLVANVRSAGISLHCKSQIIGIDRAKKTVYTSHEMFRFGLLINCAGAGSLALARKFGLGKFLRLMPFRGSYFEIKMDCVRGNIYPVPDPKFPFLGVHASRSVSGRVFAGPTAWPVLMPATAAILAGEYVTDRGGMRRHMHEELRNRFPGYYLQKIKELLPKVDRQAVIPHAKSGVRAQLYDTKRKKLVTDFLVEETPESLHVLNMISPGFTCAFAFADHLVKSAVRIRSGHSFIP